jgi:DNA-binding NtrC family response regulator
MLTIYCTIIQEIIAGVWSVIPMEPEISGGGIWKFEARGECRILVVDDEETLRYVLYQALSKFGYRITLAASGEEALGVFNPGSYDIVIIDLKLPKMDGLELMQNIREKDPEVAFLVMTGYPNLESAIDSSIQGVYDYMIKPFPLGDIPIKILQLLEKKQLERSVKVLRKNLSEIIEKCKIQA